MRWLLPVPFVLAFSFLTLSLAHPNSSPFESYIRELRENNPVNIRIAARELGRLGPKAKGAAPALKELLKHRDDRIRLAAAEALWRIEHRASDLLPYYLELLTAANAEVRAAAAWRLGRLGDDSRPVVLVLAGALRDENFEVRVQAGLALANLGPLAEAALPALVRALGDAQLDEPSQTNRQRQDVKTSPALPALVEMADDAIPLLIATFRGTIKEKDPAFYEVMRRTALAFPAFGARGIAPLVNALQSEDAMTRGCAAAALREMAEHNGMLSEAAIAELEKRLDDSKPTVRFVAARALALVRPTNGKAVSIIRGVKDLFGDERKIQIEDLARMGPHNPEAFQWLIQLTEDKDVETALQAVRLLDRLKLPTDQAIKAWAALLSHDKEDVRSEAIYALQNHGLAAKPALPVLRDRFSKLNDEYEKAKLFNAIVAADPDDPNLFSFLVKWLEKGQQSIQGRAVGQLAEMGPKAKDAFPLIEAQLFSSKVQDDRKGFDGIDVRDRVEALARIASGSDQLIAVLLKALRDRQIRSRHCGKNSWFMRDVLEDNLQACMPAAAPELRKALGDKDADVRRSVALVCIRAGMDIEAALRVLADKLWCEKDNPHETHRFQRRVVEALMRRPVGATPAAAAALCQVWHTADAQAREVLEPGLVVLQREALPQLLTQLRKASSLPARRDLAHLLAKFEGQAKHVVPILREELRETSAAHQYLAMTALGAIGPEGAEAVAELVPILKHPHAGMRAASAQTLGLIGRAAKPAVPALKGLLKDSETVTRLSAADALSRIDAGAVEALDVLWSEVRQHGGLLVRSLPQIELPEAVNGSPVYIRYYSVDEGIACFGEVAVRFLADILDSSDLDEWSASNLSAQCGSDQRLQAALLLARLGPEARVAVPALMRALEDKDSFIRDAAASALGRIGPAAREAAPDLIALLQKQNRFASAAGPWTSGASGSGNRQPFDFRGAGRRALLSRDFGYYGASSYDPFSIKRPEYPHNPAYVLSRIDAEACSAQPVLAEVAKDPAHPGRLAAALALWRSRREAPDLVAAFTDALEAHAKAPQQSRAPLSPELRQCLAELGAQLKPAAPVLAELLSLSHWAIEEDAIAVTDAIGNLGSDARAEADLLRPLLRGGRWDARRRMAIAQAYYRITGDADAVFPVLRETLLGTEPTKFYRWFDRTSTWRVLAARGLGLLFEKGDKRARALLIETAKGDESPHVRVAVLEALGRTKETKAEALAGLEAVLRHAEYDVQVAAASALARLAPLPESSRLALEAAKENPTLAVRQTAKKALEESR